MQDDNILPDDTLELPAQRMTGLTVAHLARKLGIAEARITISQVQAVEWRDESLGCRRSGANYAQVITPGFLILLEAQGSAYAYHTDASSRVILCSARPPDEIFPTP